jgi:cytochrome c553
MLLAPLLAIVMVAVAIINTLLMAWLWRFPMLPDPHSGNPHGRSSAPKAGLLLHRVLGYLYLVSYTIILTLMLPRLWRFQVWPTQAILHAGLGLSIGFIFVVKIGVIRLWPRHSACLPWLGALLMLLTIAAAGLGIMPLYKVTQTAQQLSPHAQLGQALYAQRCLQCHGATMVAREVLRADKWHRELRKMQKHARRATRVRPVVLISDAERKNISAFLIESRGYQKR